MLNHRILSEEQGVSYFQDLISLEKEWRNILLSGEIPQRQLNLHLLIGVDVAVPVGDQPIVVPDRFVLYMARGVDAGLTDTDTKAMLFLKLPRFLFIYPLHGFDSLDFINSALSSTGGMYYLNEVRINDSDIGDFVFNRAKMIEDMFSQMSALQKEKMRKFTDEKWSEVKEKDLGIISVYQQRMKQDNN